MVEGLLDRKYVLPTPDVGLNLHVDASQVLLLQQLRAAVSQPV
jgi:hypothetical protein